MGELESDFGDHRDQIHTNFEGVREGLEFERLSWTFGKHLSGLKG